MHVLLPDGKVLAFKGDLHAQFPRRMRLCLRSRKIDCSKASRELHLDIRDTDQYEGLAIEEVSLVLWRLSRRGICSPL